MRPIGTKAAKKKRMSEKSRKRVGPDGNGSLAEYVEMIGKEMMDRKE